MERKEAKASESSVVVAAHLFSFPLTSLHAFSFFFRSKSSFARFETRLLARLVSELGRFEDSENWDAASNLLPRAFLFSSLFDSDKKLNSFHFKKLKQRLQVSATSTTTARRGATRTSALARQAPLPRRSRWEGSSAEGTVAAVVVEEVAAASPGTLLLERLFLSRCLFLPEHLCYSDFSKPCASFRHKVSPHQVLNSNNNVKNGKKARFCCKKKCIFSPFSPPPALSIAPALPHNLRRHICAYSER